MRILSLVLVVFATATASAAVEQKTETRQRSKIVREQIERVGACVYTQLPLQLVADLTIDYAGVQETYKVTRQCDDVYFASLRGRCTKWERVPNFRTLKRVKYSKPVFHEAIYGKEGSISDEERQAVIDQVHELVSRCHQAENDVMMKYIQQQNSQRK